MLHIYLCAILSATYKHIRQRKLHDITENELRHSGVVAEVGMVRLFSDVVAGKSMRHANTMRVFPQFTEAKFAALSSPSSSAYAYLGCCKYVQTLRSACTHISKRIAHTYVLSKRDENC